jgi:hypothetical protein
MNMIERISAVLLAKKLKRQYRAVQATDEKTDPATLVEAVRAYEETRNEVTRRGFNPGPMED